MEQKQFALQLGLPETATEAEITVRLGELKAAKEENEKLQKEKATLMLANITSVVEKAVGEKRIAPEKKDEFVTLGKEIGAERLQSVFAAMSPQVKLSALVNNHGDNVAQYPTTYTKLSEVPSDKLMELRENDPEQYKRLYKAEYGMECKF